MSDRPTPETDAMWEKWSDDRLPNGQFRYGPLDLADHARHLERQRDELRDKTVDALAKVAVLTEAADYLNGRLREVTTQRDELMEMLERCEMWLSTLPEGRAMQLACRAAIAAVKGGNQ